MQEVLKLIKPTKKEEQQIKKTAQEIIKKIKIPNTKISLGGSSAKGTWLRNNHDIDIYIKFNQKIYSGADISDILKATLKDAKELHGSRNYFQIEKGEYTIELIPIIDIKRVENAENITDISPFHTKWVRKHKKYADDIRLAKAFAKANRFYGAESYIRGFSGYAMEILTIHYKGFHNLIKNAAKWKSSVSIDTAKHHKTKIQLNEAKMLSPIILVDPVQATRNVTAVISKEKYKLFIEAAKAYLKHSSPEFFIAKDFIEELKKKKGNILTIQILPQEGKRDVVGAKILQCFEYVQQQLEKNDFLVKEAGWHWKENENALFYFIINNEKLSEKIKHYGPPSTQKQGLKQFKQKWKGKIIKKEANRIYIELPRTHTDPNKLLKEIIKSEYIKARVKESILD
ncbi:CCA tRNA nucleotidyltransferase [Candidatus Woesearchaeota archaeon]|nr:CCA tRNA nucleotidyltransferase [Candidatus Woesearchaeota archaeon]